MGWWSWESQNRGFLRMGGKTASSRSHTVTPGRLNYNHHAGGRIKTVSLHGKTRVAPAHKRAWLPIPEQDAGMWGLTPSSGHCLVWGCSVGISKPASWPELIPAPFLLWPAQPVLCPAQGSVAQVSAGAGHPVLQTGMGDGAWQHPHHSPRVSQGPSLAPLKQQHHNQAAGELEGPRYSHGLGAIPSPLAAGDVFATPPAPPSSSGPSSWLQTAIC